MHVPSFLIAAAGLFLPTSLAVFADDAWTVDWHHALVGSPHGHSTFFHQPVAGSKASLLYTLSDRSVLAAVNPKDGSLRWRQQLGPSNSTFLRAGQDQDTVVSAVDGQVAAWSAADGRQAWSLDLDGAPVRDLEILEMPEGNGQAGSKDAVVLTGGPQPVVQRIGRESGQPRWLFRDESGDVPFQVSASATRVFYISLHSSLLGGSKIKVVSLDPVTGHKLDQYTLSSDSDIASPDDILTVGANSASPIIAWTDKARSLLKVNVIGAKTVSSFDVDSDRPILAIALHAPYHINAQPHFLVHYETAAHSWAEVYHVDLSKSSVSKAYSLPKLAGRGAFSASTSDANVYFTRISEADVSVVSSVSHGVLARWPLTTTSGLTLQSDHAPIHAVAEVSLKSDAISAVRCAVYLASGEWLLIRDGTPIWERVEALSSITSVVWSYLPASEKLVHELELEGHSNVLQAYLHRIKRHVGDLQALPGYLTLLPGRLAHGIGFGQSAVESSASPQDTFGYHKKIVCATDTGRLIALDASSGQVVWNVKFADNTPSSPWKVPELTSHPDGTVLVTSTDGSEHKTFDVATGKEVQPTGPSTPADRMRRPSFTYTIEEGKVVGSHESAASLWQFAPTSGEAIYSLTPRPFDDPVASIGKVLGDRRVLYKYLNPNTLLVITVSDKTTATVSILDALTGSVIYAASHHDVDTSLAISSTISENWFAYSFASQPESSGIKGYQLVVGEMYESPFPNDRGPHGSAANASEVDYSYQPYVVAQTYRIREPISKMGVTQTRQGITSRALLAVLPESNAVIAIPRAVIDPRRPVGRDATKDEMMEGLVRYSPVLEFDPKWYLTHQREVFGIDQVTTSPAVLESTSLVFAHGLDVFGTRISPSFSFDVLGKDFNKVQMLATVAALAVATVVVAPLVKRKQVNTRWQFS